MDSYSTGTLTDFLETGSGSGEEGRDSGAGSTAAWVLTIAALFPLEKCLGDQLILGSYVASSSTLIFSSSFVGFPWGGSLSRTVS